MTVKVRGGVARYWDNIRVGDQDEPATNAFGAWRGPQPAIMLVSRGLARTARALSFWILFAQWSSVPLQPPERHFVTLPEGLTSTR